MVTMVDDIDPSFQAGHDTLFRNDMPTNLFAPFVRRLGGSIEFILAHGHNLGRPEEAVAASRIELDDIDAQLDLFAHRLAEVVRSVADASKTIHVHFPEVGVAIDRVTSGDKITTAGEEARAGNHAGVNRPLERNVDVMHGAR